ncbi:retrovirus-related pol polyprotein from transposon TNT 1-94 [Tanacetum coccineum]
MMERKSCVLVIKPRSLGDLVGVLVYFQGELLSDLSNLSKPRSSELGSELILLAGSELKTSEYRFLKIFTLYAGSDTRPPMLDRTDFASWQQLIRLYCRGKENGVNILKSINEGPFQMGTFRETLAEGNEGETIHDYYVQFAKLINDMRNIKITMSIMQLNSKFVNNMLPKWGRFVTAVKLNRGLRDFNYDQFSTTHNHLQIHHPHITQLDLGLSPTDNLIENLTNTLALLTQSYKTYLPQTNNQLRTSSNPRNQATVQDGRVVVQNVQGRQNRGQGNNAWGAGAGYGGAQNRVGNANPWCQARHIKFYNCNSIGHIARNCTQPKRPQNSEYFKDKMLLMQAQENRVALDEEQLLFIAGRQDNAINEDVDEQPTMFMANLSSADPVYDKADSSYVSDTLSEVHDHDHNRDAVCEHHEEHEMHDDVKLYARRARFELTEREQKIDEQLRIVITDRNIKEEKLKKELHSIKMQLASTINHNKSMVEEVTSLKKDFKQKENKYLEEFLDMKALKEKDEDKLYKQDQSLQTVPMSCKPKPYYDEQNKVKISPPDYSKENYLATFTPQKQLTPEQIFWSQDLIKIKAEALKKQTTTSRPIKVLMVYPPNTPATLVPGMLPTKRLTEGERGFEQTKECYLTEVIPFFETLKEHFEGIQKALTKEIKEMKDIFEELEAEVDQNAVNRRHDEIKQKNILIAHDYLIVDCLSEDVFYIATNSELTLKYQNLKESFGNNPPPPARVTLDFDSVFVIGKMKASFQGKDNVIKKLKMQISQLKETRSKADRTLNFRALDFQITHLTEKVTVLQEQNELFRAENEKIKQHYKELYDSIKITRAKHIEQITAVLTENENLKAQIQNKIKCVTKDHIKPTVLAPGKYAIDVEPIPSRNRNNREVHLDYLKHLKESVETLREIVEEAKIDRPLDRSIVFACRYTKHSQELLECAIGTCPKDFNQRDKKHAPTLLIRKKQITFKEQCDTSNSNIHKHVEQLNTQKTNVRQKTNALCHPSTGVKAVSLILAITA